MWFYAIIHYSNFNAFAHLIDVIVYIIPCFNCFYINKWRDVMLPGVMQPPLV